MDVLRYHLEKRGVDTENEMKKRLLAAKQEITQTDLFDFTVTNKEHNLDQAVNRVIQIIETESLKKPTREIRL